MDTSTSSEEWLPTDNTISKCPEPIAIIGMGCRWPGGVSTPSQLWDFLLEKGSGFSDFPKEKLNLQGFYHPNQQRPGSFYTKGGYFLKDDLKRFDHGLFDITPLEAMTMDPAQRKLLEVVFEAFESAGEPRERISGSRTGVFVGNFNYDHQIMQFRDADHPLPYVTTGGGITILSNRVNYVFNLRGPSMTIDTACSSSLYALHLAVNAIRSNDCDAAIVAGSNLILGPEAQLFTTKLGAISPTSTCHTFDAAADGYARAEGVGALYVMRMTDAIAGSYPIRAVVRGTSINANGRTTGISHPSSEGQEKVIRGAYENAGCLDPSLTGYFECHGTGTAVGDPLEVEAIGKVFSPYQSNDEQLLIGSIKPNIGHSEAASGIAGIMKAVLAIGHGKIPPTIGVVNPNPKINFRKAQVKIVTETTKWPSKPIRRASINCFGYGGANAHAILDHPEAILTRYNTHQTLHNRITTNFRNRNDIVCQRHPPCGFHSRYKWPSGLETVENLTGDPKITSDGELRKRSSNHASSRALVLLPFSAQTMPTLKTLMNAISEIANRHNIADLAYTLASRRSLFACRAFALVRPGTGITLSEMEPDNFGMTGNPSKKLAFVFSGQGTQWAGVGKELFEFAVFRQSIQCQDRVLQNLSFKPVWTIEGVCRDHDRVHNIHDPRVSQTVCTAVQIALVKLLESWGIKPWAVIGHSSGEIAAAFAARRHTAAEAIIIAYCRGQAVSTTATEGLMIAVGAGVEKLAPCLSEHPSKVKVAAYNSHQSVTLSGDIQPISQLTQKLQSMGIFCRTLKTGGKAYHSHHMTAVGDSYQSLVSRAIRESLSVTTEEKLAPAPRWFSSVLAREIFPHDPIDASYWRKNLESPVLFSQATKLMMKSTEIKLDAFLDIGAHPALLAPLKETYAAAQNEERQTPAFLATLVRNRDALTCMLRTAGSLFLLDQPIDIAAINAMDELEHDEHVLVHGRVCLDLPAYPYNYGPNLYFENRFNREWRNRIHLRHDLLGARQAGTAKASPSWRNMLRLKDVPWLEHHKIATSIVFPAAGYILMSIEAVSQYQLELDSTPLLPGFIFRNVNFSSMMQVPDDEIGIEVVTTIHNVNFAVLDVSPRSWFEFRISSVLPESDTWTEHCTGLVAVSGLEIPIENSYGTSENRRFLQPGDISRWYSRFNLNGLVYGKAFQGLSNLAHDTTEGRAVADLALQPADVELPGGASNYLLHPGALDTCFQLALIAAHDGRPEHFQEAYVPVTIEEMSLKMPQDPLEESSEKALCTATGSGQGLRALNASVQLFSNSGSPLLDLKSLRCVTYLGSGASGSKNNVKLHTPYMRLEWKPDIDFLDTDAARTLFPPSSEKHEIAPIFDALDQLTAYIIVQQSNVWQDQPPEPESDDLRWFIRWFKQCYASAQAGTLRFGAEALSKSSKERIATITQLFEDSHRIPEVHLMKQNYDSLRDILEEKTSALEVALQNDTLKALYVDGIGISYAYPQLKSAISLIAHKNPGARILEIGAGTGGATRQIMQVLASDAGLPCFSQYTFTDITPSFLAAGKTEFADISHMSFATLDIERSPAEQGFDSGYDLIIASQVLHATASLEGAVKNARSLLKPGGKMILLELTRSHMATSLILGMLPGFWSGVGEGRIESPMVSKDQWHTVLTQGGFSGIDVLLDDHPQGYETASVIFTTAVEPGPVLEPKIQPKITVLASEDLRGIQEAVRTDSNKRNIIIDVQGLIYTSLPPGAHVIYLANVKDVSSIFRKEETFASFQSVINQAASVLFVSIGNPITGQNPLNSMLTGLLRIISSEKPLLKLAQMELGTFSEDSLSRIASIIVSFQSVLSTGRASNFEHFVTFHQNCLYISRVVPDQRLNNIFQAKAGQRRPYQLQELQDLKAMKAAFEHPGAVNSLFFERDVDFDEELRHDWVEIKTAAIGLNAKDVAVMRGRFDSDNLNIECAGIVSKVSSSISHLKCGDHVYGLVPGKFGNYMRCASFSVQKMALEDKFEDMASIPVAYCTAIYALQHLARLSKGETVLIQSAAGGLGLAAMRIAMHLGAEIYATVGTESKILMLQRLFGISRARIFRSRDFACYNSIMEATAGQGMDVILCSAGGEHMHESWRCIAPAGRFIEVGRTEILSSRKLGLEVFKRNATFSSFDMGLLYQQKPRLLGRLLTEVDTLYRDGVIKPIDFIEYFDISQLEQAVAHFSKGTHFGKIVVRFDSPESQVKILPRLPSTTFNANATYVLAGLGGLGRALSMWMVDKGAKHLTLLSRSGENDSTARDFCKKLRKESVEVEVITCDISISEDLVRVIGGIPKTRPIQGIFHTAMVLEASLLFMLDITFDKMNFAQLRKVLLPKVEGTVNLHEATLHLPLDFFIMISSIITLIGTATQANYSAANAFQDAFARYRQSQGLPAQSIALGLLSDFGFASDRPDLQKSLARNGVYGTSRDEIFGLLDVALSQPQVTDVRSASTFDPLCSSHLLCGLEPSNIWELKSKQNVEFTWQADARLGYIAHAVETLSSQKKTSSELECKSNSRKDLLSRLDEIIEDKAELQSVIDNALKDRLAKLLFLEVDAIDDSKTLAAYGIDSMIAAELSNWLVRVFNVNVGFLDILDPSATVASLSFKIRDWKLPKSSL